MIVCDPHPDARPAWADLSGSEQVQELRLGDDSEYAAVFADDPTGIVDCPDDGPVSIDSTGLCTQCGRDLAGPVTEFDNRKDWTA